MVTFRLTSNIYLVDSVGVIEGVTDNAKVY
jgi:hypothetical protein